MQRRELAARLTATLSLLGVLALVSPALAQTPTSDEHAYRPSKDGFQYAGTFSDIALDIDAYWQATFAAEQHGYQSPDFAALDRALDTPCGRKGPDSYALYCLPDQTIYLSPDFLAAQDAKFGDYAPIVVLAHEWGHHVQNLLQVPDLGGSAFELQADCLAGAYTLSAEAQGLLDPGDLAEAIRISEEFGDPVGLSQDQPGAHGTNAQRMKAVMRGYLDGIGGCNLPLESRPGSGPIPTLVATQQPLSSPTPRPTVTLTPIRTPSPLNGEIILTLPGVLPLPHASCLDVSDDGSLTFDELADRLGGTGEARQRLGDWGWRGSIYRTFGCDGPPEGEAGWIDISLHQFGSAAAAQEAVDTFAVARADGTALVTAAPPSIGDYAAALTGPASNGKEFTLYTSQGPLLVRVTGVSPSGIPFMNVLAVAQAVMDANRPSAQASTVGAPPPIPTYPASVYLPASPAVNYAECFSVVDRGEYGYNDVVDVLEQVGLSKAEADSLGWTDGGYVVFRCADPPFGRASQLDVVIHQFRDASQALPYFARMNVLGEDESRACDSTATLVVRVYGRSLTGSPLSDVHFALNQVIAGAR